MVRFAPYFTEFFHFRTIFFYLVPCNGLYEDKLSEETVFDGNQTKTNGKKMDGNVKTNKTNDMGK